MLDLQFIVLTLEVETVLDLLVVRVVPAMEPLDQTLTLAAAVVVELVPLVEAVEFLTKEIIQEEFVMVEQQAAAVLEI
jgi:hypothetical protein